nr:hypothetical protein [Tanacetum cinerariifolium]
MLEMKARETVTDYLRRVMVIANDMQNADEDMSDVKIIEKVLRIMTESFNFVVCTIKESRDLDSMTVDELQSSLLIHDQKIRRKVNDEKVLKVETIIILDVEEVGAEDTQIEEEGVLGHFQYECSNDARVANYAEFEDNEEILLMATVDVEGYEKEAKRLMATVSEDKHDKVSFWFLDSACSKHMTGIKEWFIRLDETYQHKIRLGNGHILEVKGKGDVRLTVNGITQVITNVYYVPLLTSNLISVGQLQEKSLTFVIQGGAFMVFHPKKGLIITSNMTKNMMFPVNVSLQLQKLNCLQVSDDSKIQL